MKTPFDPRTQIRLRVLASFASTGVRAGDTLTVQCPVRNADFEWLLVPPLMQGTEVFAFLRPAGTAYELYGDLYSAWRVVGDSIQVDNDGHVVGGRRALAASTVSAALQTLGGR